MSSNLEVLIWTELRMLKYEFLNVLIKFKLAHMAWIKPYNTDSNHVMDTFQTIEQKTRLEMQQNFLRRHTIWIGWIKDWYMFLIFAELKRDGQMCLHDMNPSEQIRYKEKEKILARWEWPYQPSVQVRARAGLACDYQRCSGLLVILAAWDGIQDLLGSVEPTSSLARSGTTPDDGDNRDGWIDRTKINSPVVVEKLPTANWLKGMHPVMHTAFRKRKKEKPGHEYLSIRRNWRRRRRGRRSNGSATNIKSTVQHHVLDVGKGEGRPRK
jgi:hypothetical protein